LHILIQGGRGLGEASGFGKPDLRGLALLNSFGHVLSTTHVDVAHLEVGAGHAVGVLGKLESAVWNLAFVECSSYVLNFAGGGVPYFELGRRLGHSLSVTIEPRVCRF